MSHSALTRRVRAGMLDQIGPDIYRIAGEIAEVVQEGVQVSVVVGGGNAAFP